MTKTIAFAAKKGGAGKTTMTLNVGGYLAGQNFRVLMIDADHQASLSQGLLGPDLVERLPKSNTIAALFDEVQEPNPEAIIHATTTERLFLAPASDLLQPYAHPNPALQGAYQFVFRDFVAEVSKHFDFVLCDAPPDCANLLSWNCLMASQFVVTPVNMESYSAQSVAGMIRRVEDAHANGNSNLQTLGYVVNLRNKRASLHVANEKKFRQLYGAQVLNTVIYDWIATPESQAKRTHIFNYAPDSEAAKAFTELGDEIHTRIQSYAMGRAA